MKGKKIAKGYFMLATDSTLILERKSKTNDINVASIGHIKTKRSGGNNVLTGSLTGMTTGIILGASTADPDAWIFSYSATEGATAFGLLGAIGGAALGGIVSGVKNSNTYIINGDNNNWKIFKEFIEN